MAHARGNETVEITVTEDAEVDESSTILKLLPYRLSAGRPMLGEYSVHVENKLGKA